MIVRDGIEGAGQQAIVSAKAWGGGGQVRVLSEERKTLVSCGVGKPGFYQGERKMLVSFFFSFLLLLFFFFLTGFLLALHLL